jgi:hypothetical protein
MGLAVNPHPKLSEIRVLGPMISFFGLDQGWGRAGSAKPDIRKLAFMLLKHRRNLKHLVTPYMNSTNAVLA